MRLEHCGWAVKFRLDVIVTGQTLTQKIFGALAQMGEHLSGRQKVTGSIHVGSTKIWPGRLVARTLPFQGREAGSEPVRATI